MTQEERVMRAREVLAGVWVRHGRKELAETIRKGRDDEWSKAGVAIEAMLAFADEGSGIGELREAVAGLLPYTSHNIGCALYQRSWSTEEPNCTCGLDHARAALSQSS